jgi:flagellar hook-basal body complex protein FliE
VIPALGIGPLGTPEWSVNSIGSLSGTPGGTTSTAPTSGSGSFSNALSSAIGSLESTQTTADTASQQLATGQSTDPTQAITAVENASLSLDYASQIRNQLDTAATTLFQTQV